MGYLAISSTPKENTIEYLDFIILATAIGTGSTLFHTFATG
jgi:hypothetical protein